MAEAFGELDIQSVVNGIALPENGADLSGLGIELSLTFFSRAAGAGTAKPGGNNSVRSFRASWAC